MGILSWWAARLGVLLAVLGVILGLGFDLLGVVLRRTQRFSKDMQELDQRKATAPGFLAGAPLRHPPAVKKGKKGQTLLQEHELQRRFKNLALGLYPTGPLATAAGSHLRLSYDSKLLDFLVVGVARAAWTRAVHLLAIPCLTAAI